MSYGIPAYGVAGYVLDAEYVCADCVAPDEINDDTPVVFAGEEEASEPCARCGDLLIASA